ncbi:hypothetical protein [Streptomyces olivaceus]|uniref:hypothetical protein n=1 Tax=Streptomyces olivaceus TaxID=47716 RepID=UPI0033ADFB36
MFTASARGAVAGDGLGGVDVGETRRGGVHQSVGQPVHPARPAGAGLLDPRLGESVERCGRAVGPEAAERDARVARNDGAHGLDAVIGARGVDGVAPAGADAEDADAVRVAAGERGERVDGAGDVLAAPAGVLRIPRLAAAAALVGRVEDESGEAGAVLGPDLLLDAAARVESTTARCAVEASLASGR